MFGLFKRREEPAGPFEFSHSIEIERPAAEVYALIDWGDARNAKRALGTRSSKSAARPTATGCGSTWCRGTCSR